MRWSERRGSENGQGGTQHTHAQRVVREEEERGGRTQGKTREKTTNKPQNRAKNDERGEHK